MVGWHERATPTIGPSDPDLTFTGKCSAHGRMASSVGGPWYSKTRLPDGRNRRYAMSAGVPTATHRQTEASPASDGHRHFSSVVLTMPNASLGTLAARACRVGSNSAALGHPFACKSRTVTCRASSMATMDGAVSRSAAATVSTRGAAAARLCLWLLPTLSIEIARPQRPAELALSSRA